MKSDTPVPDVPEMLDARTFRGRVRAFYLGSFVAAVLAVNFLGPSPLSMDSFDIESVTRVFGPLVAIAMFMERALEVLVGGLRGGMKGRLEEEIKSVESAAGGGDARKLKLQLAEFEHRSLRLAFVAAVSFGLVLSVLGVRSLEPLLATDAWNEVSTAQKSGFQLVDVVITAALLGGGSDGIHKVMKLITDHLDQASKNVRAER